MLSGKTILIAPIDWGWGHATRCAGLIRTLSENNRVIIGTTEKNAAFFSAGFPAHSQVSLPSYGIRYSARLPLWFKLLLQAPRIFRVIRRERDGLGAILRQHQVDVVISDNRFGLGHKDIHSIFLSHQLNLKAPLLAGLVNLINRRYIHTYHEVWVPDHQESSRRLSGALSDPAAIRIPVRYIGPLTALSPVKDPGPSSRFDYLLLLSGVEPQRRILESLLLARFRNTSCRVALVRGSAEKLEIAETGTLRVFDFLQGDPLRDLILASEVIICRSGYSSLMDMHVLGKERLILIPTPGQSEQEYLAAYWEKNFSAVHLPQKSLRKFNFI